MFLESQRKEFQNLAAPFRKDRTESNNSFGAYVFDDGKVKHVGRYACHGWMSYSSFPTYNGSLTTSKNKPRYALSAVMTPHMKPALMERYFDWLVNRSPWRDVFVEKDVKTILDYGHVVDLMQPNNLVGSAMIASRFPTEVYAQGFKERMFVYEELLEMGCTENEAFAFAQMYSTSKGMDRYPITFSRLSSGHSTFSTVNYQENYIRNFLENTPANLQTTSMRDNGGYAYGSLNSIWASSTSKDSFGVKVKALAPISKQKKEDLHIFRKMAATGWEYTNRKDFASVIEQLRGLIYA